MTRVAYTADRGARLLSADARWRRFTDDANGAFRAGLTEHARVLYEEALAEAEELLASAIAHPTIETCVAPMLFTVSCHNLAELARRSEEAEQASGYVLRAFERLAETAESSAAPLAIRLACVRHLGPALGELAADLESRGLGARFPHAATRAAAAAVLVDGLLRASRPEVSARV